MTPSMTSELMTIGVHPSDDCRIDGRGIIDLALAIVNSCHEESRFGIIALEYVQHIGGIDIWSVIVSQGDSTRHVALVDASPTIQNIPKLRTGITCSRSAGWSFVGITTRSVVK